MKLDALRRISIFSGVSDYDLHEIDQITVEKSYPAGSIVIEENEKNASAHGFFIVIQGKLFISKKLDGGEEVVLGVLSEGDFFGEMALLDAGPRSATVKVIEPTEVLEISRKNFETLLVKAPGLAYRVTKELSTRLRETGALLISYLQQRNREILQSFQDVLAAAVQTMRLESPNLDRLRFLSTLARSVSRHLGFTEQADTLLDARALLHELAGEVNLKPEILQVLQAGPIPASSRPARKRSRRAIPAEDLLEQVISAVDMLLTRSGEPYSRGKLLRALPAPDQAEWKSFDDGVMEALRRSLSDLRDE